MKKIILLFFFAGVFTHPAIAVQINSVEHITIEFGPEDLEKTYVLERQVNPLRTLISITGVASKRVAVREVTMMVAADFIDQNILRVTRQSGGSAIEVQLSVAEFKSGVRVQRGMTEFLSNIYQKRIAVSRLDKSKTIIFLNATSNESTYTQRAHLYFSSSFVDHQTLLIRRTDAVVKVENPPVLSEEEKAELSPQELLDLKRTRIAMPEAKVFWQAVVFTDGADLQQGMAKIPNFSMDTSSYLAEPVKRMDKSFFNFDFIIGQNARGRTDLGFVRGEFSEDSLLSFRREGSTSDRDSNLEMKWTLVELHGRANRVQRGIVYAGAGEYERPIRINTVSPERSIILLKVSGGENRGNVMQKAQIAALYFSAYFSSDDEITLKRGGALMDVTVSWTVIEFAPLTIQSPKGNEIFRVGETVPLTWTYSDDAVKNQVEGSVNTITVSASFANGNDDFPHILAEGVVIDSGSFDWLIPEEIEYTNVISKDVALKIAIESETQNYFDRTREPFEIKGVVKLISPVGGERWYIGDDYRKIEWEYKGKIGILSIYYDKESGYGYNPFPASQRIARVVRGEDGKGSFLWEDLPDAILDRVRIKIEAELDKEVYSISEKDFEIFPRIEIQLSAKEQKEYSVGEHLELHWTTSGTVDYFSLYYQVDMYSPWQLAKTQIEGGPAANYEMKWLIPAEAQSDTLRIKIAKMDNLEIFDTAPDDLGGYIRVKSWLKLDDPTAFNMPLWRPGEKRLIKWDYGGNLEYLNLEYSLDNKQTWRREAVVRASDRQYEWSIPDIGSAQIYLRLQVVGRSSQVSESADSVQIRAFDPTIG